jgi:hypothetical protein
MSVEAGGKKAVEKKIDEALFPRVDIQSALLATKIAMQRDARAEVERLVAERVVDGGKVAQAVAGEVVQIVIVGGSEERFAPGEEGFGVEGDRGLVELGFVVKVAPAKTNAGWRLHRKS